MAKTSSTPLGAMFSILKRYGGISYKELATLILSEKPLVGGASPASRVNDRTWVSRYLVHAPAEAVRSEYFVSYEKCAMRIIARLKKRTGNTLGNREIMEMVAGTPGQEMVAALQNAGQDATPYLNMLARLDKEGGFRAEERMEIAMVLFVAVALTPTWPKRRHTRSTSPAKSTVHRWQLRSSHQTPRMPTSRGFESASMGSERPGAFCAW